MQRLHSYKLPLARRIIGALLFCLAAAWLVKPADAQMPRGTECPSDIETFFEEWWQEYLTFRPMLATRLGIRAGYSDLDDYSIAGEARILNARRQSVATMRKCYDRTSLSRSEQVSFDLFIHAYHEAEEAFEFRHHYYSFSQFGGPFSSIPNFLISQHKVETPEDMQSYILRVRLSAQAIRQSLNRAQASAEMGIRPPIFAYRGAIDLAQQQVEGEPFSGPDAAPLWSDGLRKISFLLDNDIIASDQAASLTSELREALTDDFGVAVREYIDWLQTDIANASRSPLGAASLPDGEAFYAHRLKSANGQAFTPAEIHQLGLAHVARLRSEMEAVLEQVNFNGSVSEFFVFVRSDGNFFYPNDDEGRLAYLEQAEQYIDRMSERLPDAFDMMPPFDLEVRRVPSFREIPGGPQHYVAAAPDGSRPGIFYIHLSDMLLMPNPFLEAVTYHESIPGHHLQSSIAQSLTDIPKFRTQLFYTSYGEGWALYAERIALELGGYDDPYSDFGRLSSEMWRAVRLVVDTGIHINGWTEDEAVDYFLENTPMQEHQARSEVRRYFVAPGQATAYMIGMQSFIKLRQIASRELGSRFDVREFHNVVLCGGAMPLTQLEDNVRAWVAEKLARPGFRVGSCIQTSHSVSPDRGKSDRL